MPFLLFNINYNVVQHYGREIQGLSNNVHIADKAQSSLADKISQTSEKLKAYLISLFGIQRVISTFRDLYNQVKQVDTAMVELRKVTDETASTYDRFLKDAAVRAKELGASLADVVTATADFARLGYSIPDSSTLADAALVYKNVGEGINNVSDASGSIISTMKAFGIQASDSMSIVDKFNEVGNRFAISSRGIGEAFLRSASALSAANNTIDESIGLFVAANNVVQDPEVVGTALRTMSMRLRNTAGALQELGEDSDGAVESITKLQTELLNLTKGKVDIMLDADTFKSTYQILVELSQVWGSLTDKAQADVTRLVAGLRQGNVMTAIMANLTEGISATEVSLNSFGSAMKENEVWLDSIVGKLSQQSAAWQELSTTVVNSDLVKGGIGASTWLIEIVNQIGQSFVGRLIAAAAGVTVLSSAFRTLSKTNLGTGLKTFATDIGELKILEFRKEVCLTYAAAS